MECTCHTRAGELAPNTRLLRTQLQSVKCSMHAGRAVKGKRWEETKTTWNHIWFPSFTYEGEGEGEGAGAASRNSHLGRQTHSGMGCTCRTRARALYRAATTNMLKHRYSVQLEKG